MLILTGGVYAQDAALTSVIGPADGCDLGNESISIVVLNNSSMPNPIPGGTITLHYSVNGGPTVSQPLVAMLNTGATWNFTFDVPSDFSTCNYDFNVVTWLEYGADVDPTNDTLSWAVRNDCTIVPGQVDSDELVCDGINSNTLNLNGWQHGTITNWIYSEDNGATWNSIPNTTTSHGFNNLTDETQFAVEIDGGHCPNATSGFATITIQPTPVGGSLTGPAALCISSANGTIDLTGNSGAVLDWETSIDNGTTWIGIGNTTTQENFSGLTQTTMYRALIDGGVCADVYSSIHEVYIEEATVAGTLETDTLICENQAVNLVLSGNVGAVDDWESSVDGTNWSPITNTSTTHGTGPLSTPTYYRVNVTNGICPADQSNQVFVDVQENITPGTISGGTATCAANASGALTLNGNNSPVIHWEQSTNQGANWNIISNTSNTENYSSLSQTTWYRVLVDGGVCSDQHSDTAFIVVSPISVGGTLTGDTSICYGDPFTLSLTGNVGDVSFWESSADGVSWTTINNTDSSYTIPSVTSPNYYRVIVKSGVCAEDTSNQAFVQVLSLPVVDAGTDANILQGDSVELNGSGGVLALWSADSTLSDTTIYNPVASPLETTDYYLTVISLDGCFNSDTVTVNVGPPIPSLDVKNLITPNNDGFNDTWIIEGIEAFPNMAVKVYNIYGVLVFEDEDYKNDWGGIYGSKLLPNGTYLYIVMPGGTEDILKGNLTILGDE